MKLFNTSIIDAVKLCRDYFDFDLYLCVMIEKQRKTFLARFDIVEKSVRWPVRESVLVKI